MEELVPVWCMYTYDGVRATKDPSLEAGDRGFGPLSCTHPCFTFPADVLVFTDSVEEISLKPVCSLFMRLQVKITNTNTLLIFNHALAPISHTFP